MSELFLHGSPIASAIFKKEPADFRVTEELGFDLTGEGEHLFLFVEKVGENTHFLQRKIAEAFGVSPKQVSYAGLKDRHAITQQWFGVHLPGKPLDKLPEIAHGKVLQHKRHNKKLKTGQLAGNHFAIRLRNVSDQDDVNQRLLKIRQSGVPNYFGEQRFGRDGGNVDMARAMFNGKRVKQREKRSLYLSAARSWLFNQAISKRIALEKFDVPMDGDCFLLSGSNSFFTASDIDDTIKTRLREGDIQLSAPLFGAGDLASEGCAKDLESEIAESNQDIVAGLANNGLKQQRRAIKLMPQQFEWAWMDQDLNLSFYLDSGSYATSVIRELVDTLSGEEQ